MTQFDTQFEAGLLPVHRETREQVRQRRVSENPAFTEILGAGFRNENLMFSLLRRLERYHLPIDPEDRGLWGGETGQFEELTEGLPSSYWDALDGGNSFEERRIIAAQLREIHAADQLLQQAGYTGLAARMLAAVLDPIAISVELGTAGLGTVATKGRLAATAVRSVSQLSRRHQIVRAGLISGLTEGSIEAVLSSDNPTKGVGDILVAGATAGIIGGGLTAVFTRGLNDTVKKVQLAETRKMIAELPEETVSMTAKAQALVDEHFKLKTLKDVARGIDLQGEEQEAFQAILGRGSITEAQDFLASRIPQPDEFRFVGKEGATEAEVAAEADRLTQLAAEFQDARSRMSMMASESELAEGAGEAAEEIAVGGEVIFRNAEGVEEVGTISRQSGEYYLVFDEAGDEIALLPAAVRIPTSAEADVAARRAWLNDAFSRDSIAKEERLRTEGQVEAAEAARTPPPPPEKGAHGLFMRGKSTDAKSFIGWDMAAGLGRSASSFMRRAASVMMQDALPKAKGAIQTFTASEFATQTGAAFRGVANLTLIQEFKGFRKARGVPIFGRWAAQDEFLEDVGRTIRGAGSKYPGNEFVERASNNMRKVFADLLELAKQHGVRGFEFVLENANYLPRIWKIAAIDKMLAKYEDGEVTRLISGALMSGHVEDGLTQEVSDKWANAILKAVKNSHDYTDMERSGIFNGERLDLLESLLRAKGSGVSDADASKILDVIQGTIRKPGQPAPLTTRGKKRAKLDEAFSLSDMKIRDGNGTLGTVALADLVENNVHELMELYVRQITGAIGMTEVFAEMSEQWGRSINNFSDLKRAILRDMRDSGVSEKEALRDIEKLETVHNSIVGRRLVPSKPHHSFMRGLRLYNHITSSGQFGVAQVPELGIAIGSVGLRAMWQQMPAMKAVLTSFRDGVANDALVNDLRVFVGTTIGRRNDSLISRFDTADQIVETGGGWKETGLRRVAKLANDVSLFAPFHMIQQTLVGSAAAQRLLNIANGRGVLSKHRQKAMGWNDDLTKRIMQNLKDNSTHVPTEDGGRLRELNLATWDDAEAAASFSQGLYRWSTTAVQENDIGNLAQWMTRPWGQMLIQFRAFPFVALRKQFFRKGFQFADKDEAFTATMETAYSLMLASSAYYLQQRALSLGMPESKRRKFLRDRLSDGNIIFASVQRAGFASFLPDAIDSGYHMLGGETGIFNFRNSGLGTTSTVAGLTSNPTTALIDRGISSFREIAQSVRGQESYSDEDLRRFSMIMPFGRAFGVHNMFHVIGREALTRERR
jgi:hypothetical protein